MSKYPKVKDSTEKDEFPLLSILCLGAAILYLVYVSIGLFQDHYIGEHFERAMHLQHRLELFSIIIPFGVQLFQYKALRKTKVYLAWLVLSVIMLGLYFKFSQDRSLTIRTGISSINGFRALFIFLIWFKLCSLVSKKVYGSALVLPSQDMFQTKSDNRPYDISEKRMLNILDYVALFGAWIVIIISIFY